MLREGLPRGLPVERRDQFHLGPDRCQVCGAANLRHRKVLRGLREHHAVDLHPLPGHGPRCRRGPFRRQDGRVEALRIHLFGPGPGAQSDEDDRAGARLGRMGAALQLPPHGELDVEFGSDRGAVGSRRNVRQLPAVAHLHAGEVLPGAGSPEWRQDDQRATLWIACEPLAVILLGDRKVVRGVKQTRRVQDLALRLLLLPCRGSGPAQVRAYWMEHPLRLHARGLGRVPPAAHGVHQQVRSDPVQGPELLGGEHQLWRPGD
mmetsp:Transcript_59910/g.194205  ORF Transcript_59910/g.194205 Transcript_59910/m.194205 type:complete len:262 (+) Transcript_59910:2714-3499(+)